jgi:mono/diheme cytochrome c family protein
MKMPLLKRYGSGSLLSLAGLAAASLAGCVSVGSDPFDIYDYEPVVVSAVPPPAVSGGTLVVTSDGKTAVAADPDRDRVLIVDLEKRLVRSEVAVPRGEEPGRVALDGAGRAHVALRRAGALLSIDIAKGLVVDRRAVCPAPRGVAFDVSSDTLHVACEGGELISLPASGGEATRKLKLDQDLRDVVVEKDRLLVSRFRSAELLVVSPDGGIEERKALPSFKAVVLTEQTFEPSVAWRLVKMPGGGAAMVHQRAMTTPVTLSPGGYYNASGCDGSILHSAVSIFRSPATGAAGPTEVNPSEAIPATALPVDVAVSDDGSTIAMAAAGSNRVVLMSTTSVEADAGHQSCAPSGAVDAPLIGQPVAVASSPQGFIAQIREPSALVFVKDQRVIALGGESRADSAHDMFHAPPSGFGSIACASCHPEGSQDGRVWNFDQVGARRTQTVAMNGLLSQTAPFHWSGDLDGMTKLMGEVFSSRMGGTPVGERRARLMLRWLDTLPALPTAEPSDALAVERGRALFNDETVACATCHSGSALTNNRSENVGSGALFQVPSLIGVASRPPFMHDGCAATLKERFTKTACGGGDQHGVTSHLNEAQIDDLVAYLESL